MRELSTLPAQTRPPNLPGEERENPHMPLRRLVDAMARGRALLVLTTAIGATLATGFAILKQNEFISTTTFFLRGGSEQLQVRTISEDGPLAGSGVHQNAPHILGNPELAARTVKRVGLDKIFAPYRPPATSDWPRSAILDLQRKLHDVDVSQFNDADAVTALLNRIQVLDYGQGMLTVSYTANDAHVAQHVLQGFVAEAKAFHLEIYRDEKAIQMVKDQHAALKKEHKKVRDRVSAFLEKTGVYDFPAELKSAEEKAQLLRRQVTDLQIQLPGLELTAKTLRKEFEQTQPVKEERTPVPVPNQMIPVLANQVSQAEDRLANAVIRLAPGSKLISELRKQVADLKGKLEEEQKKPARVEYRTTNIRNAAYDRVRDKLLDADSKLATAQAKLAKLRADSKAADAKWQVLAQASGEYKILAADLSDVEKDVALADNALEQALEKERMEASQHSSLRVVTEPTFNPIKVGPNRSKLVLLGLLGGFGFGVALLAFRSLTDTTVRTPEELEQLVGVRVLATVPELNRRNVRRHEQRLLSGC